MCEPRGVRLAVPPSTHHYSTSWKVRQIKCSGTVSRSVRLSDGGADAYHHPQAAA